MSTTTPKLNVPQVPQGEHTAIYLNSLSDQRAVEAYLDFFISILDLPPDDEQLVEVARIRNGLTQNCQYCLSVRHADPLPGKDFVELAMNFEDSDVLSDRQKAAMRLAAAFLERPSALTPEVREQALEHFSPEEITGFVFKLTSFIVNKPRSALGIDRPLDEHKLTRQDYGMAREMRAQESEAQQV